MLLQHRGIFVNEDFLVYQKIPLRKQGDFCFITFYLAVLRDSSMCYSLLLLAYRFSPVRTST